MNKLKKVAYGIERRLKEIEPLNTIDVPIKKFRLDKVMLKPDSNYEILTKTYIDVESGEEFRTEKDYCSYMVSLVDDIYIIFEHNDNSYAISKQNRSNKILLDKIINNKPLNTTDEANLEKLCEMKGNAEDVFSSLYSKIIDERKVLYTEHKIHKDTEIFKINEEVDEELAIKCGLEIVELKEGYLKGKYMFEMKLDEQFFGMSLLLYYLCKYRAVNTPAQLVFLVDKNAINSLKDFACVFLNFKRKEFDDLINSFKTKK